MRTLALAIVALVALPLAAEISGTVIDLDGFAVAGARIAANRAGTPVGSAMSDANGAFVLDAGDGFIEIVVEKDGYATERRKLPADERGLSIVLVRGTGPAEEPALRRDVESAGTETITGIVRDEAKRPIAGIGVAIRRDNFFTEAATGEKGEFVVKIAPGAYEVSIEGGDYLYGDTVRVPSGGSCELVAKRLPSADGVVLDYDGKPVRGARVSIIDVSWEPVVSDVRGRFRMQLPADPSGQLIAWKTALPAITVPLPALGEARHGMTLTFPRGIDVNGVVTDQEGRGLGGVSINQSTIPPAPSISEAVPVGDWARTASDGTFSVRIGKLPTELHFAKEGYLDATQPVEVTPAMRPLAVRLKQLTFVRGKLRRRDGTVVAGEIIKAPDAIPDETSSAADGSFELGFPAAGEYSVEAGLVNTSQTVRAPSKNVRLVFDEGLTISGRVIDEATGATLDVDIMLSAESKTSPHVVFLPSPSRFTLRGFEQETVTISVTAIGYAPAKVKVEAGRKEPVVIALKRGRTLHGRVHDAGGKPVQNATIRIEDRSSMVESDGEGAFEVNDVAPHEPAKLTIDKDGYLSRSIEIAPEELGKTADILLSSGLSVKGRVVGPNGKPVAIDVVAKSAGYGTGSGKATSDADGQFEITGLSPARYDFDAGEGSDELTGRLRDVDVEHVREITIEVERRPANVPGDEASGGVERKRSLTGRVTRGGRPLEGAQLMFRGSSSGYATTDREGRYEILLEPGHYAVMIEIQHMKWLSFDGEVDVDRTSVYDVSIEISELRVRVVDGETGQPLRSARVAFVQMNGDQELAETTADGIARLEITRGSKGVVQASMPGYATAVADPGDGDVTVKLVRPSDLNVRVVDARDGRTLDGCVAAYDLQGRAVDVAWPGPDSDGVARLDVGPGDYRVIASTPGYASAVVRASAPSSELRIGLRPGSGALVLPSTAKLRGTVRILSSDGELYAPSMCNPVESLDGKVRTIGGLAPGNYTLEITPSGGKPRRYPVTIIEGTAVPVQIDQ